MNSPKRIRRDPVEARLLILDTAKTIMLEEGYAAVSIRRVAKAANVSSTLLHYYYSTADDLLIALYRHNSEQDLVQLRSALDAPEPISALWRYQTDSSRTSLGVEFLALANHRKAIRCEIARFAEYARSLQTETLARVFAGVRMDPECSPVCLALLLTSVSRNLIMESGVGIASGHAEAAAFVERALVLLGSALQQNQDS